MSFQILACGSNGSYQLGLRNDDDHDALQHVPVPENFSRVKPKALAFGGNHTLLLYPEGQLFATGANESGQCGLNSPDILHEFTRVPGKWKHVAAGWQFSILCSFSDELYCCGLGPKGELGLGVDHTSARTLTRIELPEMSEIAAVKCSINHTVVKLASGAYIGWGVSRKGQLGPQDPIITTSGKVKPAPSIWKPVLLPFSATDYCLGRDRTVLVEKAIRILGVEAQTVDVRSRDVRAMWSSVHYRADTPEDFDICSVGNNSHGQRFSYTPQKPIRDFTVGSEHGLVVLTDNSVYAWGWGEHGNCGKLRNGNVTFDYLNEVYAGADEVVMIAGGLATSWVVVQRK